MDQEKPCHGIVTSYLIAYALPKFLLSSDGSAGPPSRYRELYLKPGAMLVVRKNMVIRSRQFDNSKWLGWQGMYCLCLIHVWFQLDHRHGWFVCDQSFINFVRSIFRKNGFTWNSFQITYPATQVVSCDTLCWYISLKCFEGGSGKVIWSSCDAL